MWKECYFFQYLVRFKVASRFFLARANLQKADMFMTLQLMIGRLRIRRLLLELGTVNYLKAMANSATDLEELEFLGWAGFSFGIIKGSRRKFFIVNHPGLNSGLSFWRAYLRAFVGEIGVSSILVASNWFWRKLSSVLPHSLHFFQPRFPL